MAGWDPMNGTSSTCWLLLRIEGTRQCNAQTCLLRSTLWTAVVEWRTVSELSLFHVFWVNEGFICDLNALSDKQCSTSHLLNNVSILASLFALNVRRYDLYLGWALSLIKVWFDVFCQRRKYMAIIRELHRVLHQKASKINSAIVIWGVLLFVLVPRKYFPEYTHFYGRMYMCAKANNRIWCNYILYLWCGAIIIIEYLNTLFWFDKLRPYSDS